MNIERKQEIKDLFGKKKLLLKNNIYYLSELNIYNFCSLLKNENKSLEIIKDKYSLLAIEQIIKDNLNEKDLNIINYILSLKEDYLVSLGKLIANNIRNLILSKNFIKDDFKAILYIDNDNLCYDFIFKELKDLQVLFIYNEQTCKLKIIDNKGCILNNDLETFNDIEINEFYINFNEQDLKQYINKYINKQIKMLINQFLFMDVFFNDFIEEILSKLFSLINVCILDDNNINLINENHDKICINKELNDLLELKTSKNKTKEFNY